MWTTRIELGPDASSAIATVTWLGLGPFAAVPSEPHDPDVGTRYHNREQLQEERAIAEFFAAPLSEMAAPSRSVRPWPFVTLAGLKDTSKAPKRTCWADRQRFDKKKKSRAHPECRSETIPPWAAMVKVFV